MAETNDLVIMPLGWEAGRPVKLADALTGLAVEMMAHRSDLQSLAEKSTVDKDREHYQRRAVDLERYATAINAIALQLEPERWERGAYIGLLELAQQHSITLPDWMTKSK